MDFNEKDEFASQLEKAEKLWKSTQKSKKNKEKQNEKEEFQEKLRFFLTQTLSPHERHYVVSFEAPQCV